MSLRIWKFTIPVPEGNDGYVTMKLPKGAQPLSVGAQRNGYTGEDQPVMWARVPDPDDGSLGEEEESRPFRVLATGQEYEPASLTSRTSTEIFLGTVQLQLNGGDCDVAPIEIVLHVFMCN